MLCKLSDLKIMLDISDNTQDDKLNLIIKNISSKIESYIGYKLGRKTYTDEIQAVNNNQVVYFNHFPIQSVASVSINDVPVDDYKILPKYSVNGGLYRGAGWCGMMYTRTMEQDIVSGSWSIKATYTAGYYLPNDTKYVDGNDDSLPYDIINACLNECVLNYNMAHSVGLKSYSEGGQSVTLADNLSNMSLSVGTKEVLNNYKYYAIA